MPQPTLLAAGCGSGPGSAGTSVAFAGWPSPEPSPKAGRCLLFAVPLGRANGFRQERRALWNPSVGLMFWSMLGHNSVAAPPGLEL